MSDKLEKKADLGYQILKIKRRKGILWIIGIIIASPFIIVGYQKLYEIATKLFFE